MSRFLSTALKYGISLLCLIHAFRGVPLKELWDALGRFSILPMFGVVAVSLMAYAVMGLRLTRMNAPPLSFPSAFCATLAGLAVNNVMPAKAGEVAKAVWIGRSNRVAVDAALGIVFMERFFDVNVLALLSLWFVWYRGQGGAAFFLLSGLAVGWLVLFLMRRHPESIVWLARRLQPLSPKLSDFIRRFLSSLVRHLTARRLAWMTATSLAVWSLYALEMTLVLNGAAGLGLSLEAALSVFALSSLGMLLPSSPGAIGVYEAVTVAALRAHDVPHDQALAAALFAHMAQFIPVTLSGGLMMLFFPSEASKACDKVTERSAWVR